MECFSHETLLLGIAFRKPLVINATPEVHSFRRDAQDDERVGIHESHLHGSQQGAALMSKPRASSSGDSVA